MNNKKSAIEAYTAIGKSLIEFESILIKSIKKYENDKPTQRRLTSNAIEIRRIYENYFHNSKINPSTQFKNIASIIDLNK